MPKHPPARARYAALLRGVSPQNAKMPEVKRAFEAAGFTAVVTHASSGNVLFDAPSDAEDALEARALRAMEKHLARSFPVFVRGVAELTAMIAGDPWQHHTVAPDAKRVVTLLRAPPPPSWEPPAPTDGVTIHGAEGRYVFTSYVPGAKGPMFMVMLERSLGADITTRTWDALQKLVAR